MPKYEMKSYTVSTNAPIPEGDPDFDPKNPKKTRKVELPTATVPEFSPDQEGLQAAVEYFASRNGKNGIAYVMDRFNAQIATDARNSIRSEFTKTPGDDFFKSKAFLALTTDPEALTQMREHASDPTWVEMNLIDPKIAQLKKEYLAQKSAQAKPVSDTTEGEE